MITPELSFMYWNVPDVPFIEPGKSSCKYIALSLQSCLDTLQSRAELSIKVENLDKYFDPSELELYCYALYYQKNDVDAYYQKNDVDALISVKDPRAVHG